MIERSFDWQKLEEVVTPYKHEWVGFNAQDLLKDYNNILLWDGEDNYGLFEASLPGEYFGHYLFGSARGRRALTVARQMLDHFFSEYGAVVVRGQTPVEHKGALGLNKLLGFKTIGIEQTVAGPCEQVFLTKEGFYNE